jgi:hypothetical protein
MSETPNRPDVGNEADESADARLLFARILERLDRLEKKIDAMGNNRPRPWSGNGQDNRRPGGSFNRPFKPNGFSPRPGGPGRFDGGRGPRFDGARGPRPHQGHKPFGNRPQTPR